MSWYCKNKRIEKKRRMRLARKLQKAKLTEYFEEIKSLPSWNQRFRRIVKAKAVGAEKVFG